MSFFSALIAPLVNFFLAYKWYFIIAILLYILLTTLFRSARGAITVVFCILVLFFIITNIGSIFRGINTLFTDLGETSEQVTTQYSQTVSDKVLNGPDLTPGEKVSKATMIFLGIDDESNQSNNNQSSSEVVIDDGSDMGKNTIELGFWDALKNIGNVYAAEFRTLTHMS